ncbi:MAG: flagellar biosynthetic protein FliO [Desulfuromonadaceae bacterium]|nr:flagellar biosynthetic protein FliO [Desulfuromonadaceae bacterium]MDD2855191.1 flagellar biosynthetic protein FliO [Desulfuromonadaceae bacterium]
MICALFALLSIFPSIALAAESSSQEFSFLASFLQMLAALALVVGLILITWHFSGRFIKRLPVGQQLIAKNIRIIETRYLGPKKSLLLVEVGGEYMLLSSSEAGLQLVKQIDMLEEIEVIEEKEQQASFATLLNRFRQRQ